MIFYQVLQFTFVTIVGSCCLAQAKTLTNQTNITSSLYSHLLDDFDTRVHPVADQSAPVGVQFSFTLCMLVGFDDLSGRLDFLGEFMMNWTDDRLEWNPASYGGKTEIIVPKSAIWVPEVTMPTSLNRYNIPGSSASKVRVKYSGSAVLVSDDLMSVTCSLDVKEYPNDKQACNVMIYPGGYTSQEVRLFRSEHKSKVSIENSEWMVKSTSKLEDNDAFVIYFELERRQGYIQITLQAPILTLAILNPWVFLLPPESGERVSLSITAFLSFTVYMGILTDHIPRASKPIPDALYEVFINIIYSAAILFCTILSLKLHMRSEERPVPQCIQTLLTCSWRKRRLVASEPEFRDRQKSTDAIFAGTEKPSLRVEKQNIHEQQENKLKALKQTENTSAPSKVTWATIGYLFDICMLILFYSFYLSVTLYYNQFT